MEGWRVDRPARARVRPVELWDLPLDGAPLYRAVGSERVEALRREGRSESAIGARVGDDLGRALASRLDGIAGVRVAGIRIAGGLGRLPGLAVALRARVGLPVRVARGEPGLTGARRLARDGVGVDLGQTSLVVGRLASRDAARLPRDLARLPIRRIEEGPPDARLARAGRAALRDWIAGAIVARAKGAAPRLVLGIPAAIEPDGALGPCTYPGVEGWAIGPAILDALDARLPARHPWRGAAGRLSILNDAALAAFAARPPAGETWLALTLGFGPGGALVHGTGASPP